MNSNQHSNEDDLGSGPTLRGWRDGLKVFGRYSLIRQLGRGGMGEVWLGQDEKLDGREVALKRLPDQVQGDQAAINDLKKETMQCLELTHPNIVRIYDWLEDGAAAAISMEYVNGETLTARRLAKGSEVFEVAEIGDWIEQACAGLDYAHGRKVVHRDLKPANLMIDGEGMLRVLDFGIAGSLTDSMSRLTSGGAMTSGTLVYMSPQQAMGYPSTRTDDVYSLGATIYELLTSKPPFYRGNVQHQIETMEPPSMEQRREELGIEGVGKIPQLWEEVVASCLAKDPEDRPQSAEALWAELSGGSTPVVREKKIVGDGIGKRRSTGKSQGTEAVEGGKQKKVFAAVAAVMVLAVAGWWLGVAAPKPGAESTEPEPVDLAAAKTQWQEDQKKAQAAKAQAELEQEQARQVTEREDRVKALYESVVGMTAVDDYKKKAVYEQILKIDPDNVRAKEDLAQVVRRISDRDMADKTARMEKAAADLKRANEAAKQLELDRQKQMDEDRRRKELADARQKEVDRLAGIQRAKEATMRQEEMKQQTLQNKANAVGRFITNFIAAGESNQIDEVLPYYAATVERFYDEGSVGKSTIRNGRRAYIKKYPNRSYSLVSGSSTSVRDIGGGYFTAETLFDYRVSSGSSHVHSGRMRGIYKLRESGSSFEVVEINEVKQ